MSEENKFIDKAMRRPEPERLWLNEKKPLKEVTIQRVPGRLNSRTINYGAFSEGKPLYMEGTDVKTLKTRIRRARPVKTFIEKDIPQPMESIEEIGEDGKKIQNIDSDVKKDVASIKEEAEPQKPKTKLQRKIIGDVKYLEKKALLQKLGNIVEFVSKELGKQIEESLNKAADRPAIGPRILRREGNSIIEQAPQGERRIVKPDAPDYSELENEMTSWYKNPDVEKQADNITLYHATRKPGLIISQGIIPHEAGVIHPEGKKFVYAASDHSGAVNAAKYEDRLRQDVKRVKPGVADIFVARFTVPKKDVVKRPNGDYVLSRTVLPNEIDEVNHHSGKSFFKKGWNARSESLPKIKPYQRSEYKCSHPGCKFRCGKEGGYCQGHIKEHYVRDSQGFWHDPNKNEIEKASHSRHKCMECDEAPDIECRWAEGMGHAWFCQKHFNAWKDNEWHSVDAERPLKYGIASEKWDEPMTSKSAAEYYVKHPKVVVDIEKQVSKPNWRVTFKNGHSIDLYADTEDRNVVSSQAMQRAVKFGIPKSGINLRDTKYNMNIDSVDKIEKQLIQKQMKVYLEAGESPPGDEEVMQGKKGGRYYIAQVGPGVPQLDEREQQPIPDEQNDEQQNIQPPPQVQPPVQEEEEEPEPEIVAPKDDEEVKLQREGYVEVGKNKLLKTIANLIRENSEEENRKGEVFKRDPLNAEGEERDKVLKELDYIIKKAEEEESIEGFLKGYKEVAVFGPNYPDERLEKVYSLSKEVNTIKNFNIIAKGSGRLEKVIYIDTIAHNLHKVSKEFEIRHQGRPLYPILNELAGMSKELGESNRDDRMLFLSKSADSLAMSRLNCIDIFSKAMPLENSKSYWNLAKKAIKNGVAGLDDDELIILREWVYTRI
jgi:hypothetical protein